MQKVNGKLIASGIEEGIAKLIKKYNMKPKLACCLVGNDESSHIYVKNKRLACERVGIETITVSMNSSISEMQLIDVIKIWNEDIDVDGILIQLPLPGHIKNFNVLDAISPKKDVDGFHARNAGKLILGAEGFIPCTPLAIDYILSTCSLNLGDSHVVIINDSIVVGRPLSMLLLNKGATVTICHKGTKDLKLITKSADIIVVAVGKRPKFSLSADHVKDGVTAIIDVGINRIAGKVIGDVEPEAAIKARHYSGVPGGVGPVGVAMLLKNVYSAAILNKKKHPEAEKPWYLSS